VRLDKLAESIELSKPISTKESLSNGSESIPELFFSYRERRWKVKKRYESWGYKKPKFFWTGEVEIWDYRACIISLVRASDEKLKIIIRRKKRKCSVSGEKEVELRLMIGFDLKKIYKPWKDSYSFRENEGERKVVEGPKDRFVFQFNDNCWIWEWVKEEERLENSNVFRIYKLIFEEISHPSRLSNNIFKVDDIKDITSGIDDEKEDEKKYKNFIPVIYQPAVDSMKNYLTKVNCAHCKTVEGYIEIEVSLNFNNEQLRKHSFLNNIYQLYRYYYFGRIFDIETFRIRFRDSPDGKFIFHNIYSEEYSLEYDSVHGDSGALAPERDIKYYFKTKEHPVIFINTSNHALAEHDSNNTLWKWEYIPWLDNSPVLFGERNRTYLEDENEEELTKKIEASSFLGRYILRIIQKYRKLKRLLST
jgi:hypothetical protein